MFKTSLKIIALSFLIIFTTSASQAEKIKVGLVVPLTGDAASYGQDLKNALVFANQELGDNKYELIIEDDRCDTKTATLVANKLINVDKIKYALGFACNTTLIATAPIYNKSNVPVITSCATSGDIEDLGENIFRLFPSDVYAANLLADYIHQQKHNKLTILTEQHEYPLLMDRSIQARLKFQNSTLPVQSLEFLHRDSDFKSLLTKVIHSKADAVFLNTNTDVSFVTLFKQLRAQKFAGQIYASFMPGSELVRKQLGAELDGVIFSNLPVEDELITKQWLSVYKKYKDATGGSQSGIPIGLIALESFRILDQALNQGSAPTDFLSKTTFTDGLLPSYNFQRGAVNGFKFVMQKIVAGKIVTLEPKSET